MLLFMFFNSPVEAISRRCQRGYPYRTGAGFARFFLRSKGRKKERKRENAEKSSLPLKTKRWIRPACRENCRAFSSRCPDFNGEVVHKQVRLYVGHEMKLQTSTSASYGHGSSAPSMSVMSAIVTVRLRCVSPPSQLAEHSDLCFFQLFV